MRRSVSLLLLMLSLAIATAIAGATLLGLDMHLNGFPANPAPSHQTTAEKLQAEYEALFPGDSQKSSPGFAVLVKKDGAVVFEKGFGVRDLRSKTPIDAHTNFRLASFTKQFTAMAIMLLVHDGKLSYDETLTKIFPNFPAYGKNITVRNLLNHTGGLPDYEDLMEAAEKTKGKTWSPEKQITDTEVLQLLEKESHGKFQPGTQWEYSNSGYVVLGLIVAKRSGKSFGEFLHERIFSPLKMDHTLVFEKNKSEIANRAYGHSKKEAGQLSQKSGDQQNAAPQDASQQNTAVQKDSVPQNGAGRGHSQQDAFIETDQSSTSATLGDGGIYSNLEGLSKWDDALRNHTLLSEKEFQPAITPAKLPPGADAKLAEDVPASLRNSANAYGFGWFLSFKDAEVQDAHPLMWHYGESMGFKTAIYRYIRDNVTVIVLCNRTDLDQGALAFQAAATVLAKN